MNRVDRDMVQLVAGIHMDSILPVDFGGSGRWDPGDLVVDFGAGWGHGVAVDIHKELVNMVGGDMGLGDSEVVVAGGIVVGAVVDLV